MEELVLVFVVIILAMSVVLAWQRRRAAAQSAGGRTPRGASGARRAAARSRSVNYSLAPRNPEVMAGMLFELLSTHLGFEEMLSFAELVSSPEMTARYLERLASKPSLAELAGQLEFLCRGMEAHDFRQAERLQVSQSLVAKANNEAKLLRIHKNLDKIF